MHRTVRLRRRPFVVDADILEDNYTVCNALGSQCAFCGDFTTTADFMCDELELDTTDICADCAEHLEALVTVKQRPYIKDLRVGKTKPKSKTLPTPSAGGRGRR